MESLILFFHFQVIFHSQSCSTGKWSKNRLTWSVTRAGSKFSQQKIEELVDKSLSAWASVADLVFEKIRSGKADISIGFHPTNHQADGEMKQSTFSKTTLAHGTLPSCEPSGSNHPKHTHLAEGKSWSLEKGQGMAVLEVIAHELGHNLGMAHSPGPMKNSNPDLMRGWTRNIDFTEVSFSTRDIKIVREKYGPSKSGMESWT